MGRNQFLKIERFLSPTFFGMSHCHVTVSRGASPPLSLLLVNRYGDSARDTEWNSIVNGCHKHVRTCHKFLDSCLLSAYPPSHALLLLHSLYLHNCKLCVAHKIGSKSCTRTDFDYYFQRRPALYSFALLLLFSSSRGCLLHFSFASHYPLCRCSLLLVSSAGSLNYFTFLEKATISSLLLVCVP